MEIPAGRWSIGALMRAIIPISLELVVLREIWRIVLIPPVTVAMVALNLGFVFVLGRPRPWQTRIVGMLLGGLAGMLLCAGDLAVPFASGPPAVLTNILLIEAVLLDILGIGMIWIGGCMNHLCRP